MRSSSRPCAVVIALAQISRTPRSTRTPVLNRLASMPVPMATTATSTSWAPIWRIAVTLVASAWLTWVSRSAHCWTRSKLASTASTSWPRRCRSSASAEPNRPRPTTRTAPVCSPLANDRTLLRTTEQLPALPQGQRGRERDRSDPADEHKPDQNVLPGGRQLRGDPGGQPHGGERRHRLEQNPVERDPGDGDERQRRPGDQRH